MLCWAFAPLLAQQPRAEEARETLRFIRLAESKKNLDFSEDKLLQVNELLDRFEEAKIAAVRRESEIRRRLTGGAYSEDESQQLLDELLQVRGRQHQNEMDLWRDVKAILSPAECLELWLFYDRFQKEVYRRIRSIREDRQQSFQRRGTNRRRPR